MEHRNPAPAMGALVIAGCLLATGVAQAQYRPLETWSPPQQQAGPTEMDPAKRAPATTGATTADPLPVVDTTATPAPAPAAAVAYDDAPAPVRGYNRGGFFVGVQGGRGWVYDDVDQDARMVNAGYRWQAGPVALVGIELARGRLAQEQVYGEVDYASIGATARFNFGRNNPAYAVVRSGYWTAETSMDGQWSGDIDGAYVGVGLGVDFSRHFNMSLTYTTHVYFEDYYYWEDYDVHRADTLMLGAEVRF